jgi:hypothetical protein
VGLLPALRHDVRDVVLGVRREVFDAEFDAAKSRLGVKSDPEVPAAELES